MYGCNLYLRARAEEYAWQLGGVHVRESLEFPRALILAARLAEGPDVFVYAFGQMIWILIVTSTTGQDAGRACERGRPNALRRGEHCR
jgi:hypothetical protein